MKGNERMTDNDQVYLELAAEINRRAELKLPLLDMIMPNGKALCDCTGVEMGEFGRQMSRIGKEMDAAERL
jgi:hypothetical protein